MLIQLKPSLIKFNLSSWQIGHVTLC